MSVTCLHVAAGVCPACADRAQRAGTEWNHAEVWRMLEEIAESAWRDGKLPDDERDIAAGIWLRIAALRQSHEDRAARIEQGA